MKPLLFSRQEAEFETLNVLANHAGSVPAIELMHEVQNRLGCDLERDFKKLMKELEQKGEVTALRDPVPFWMRVLSSSRPESFHITPAGRNLIEPQLD